jgi:hypothetical protein
VRRKRTAANLDLTYEGILLALLCGKEFAESTEEKQSGWNPTNQRSLG